MEWESTCRFAVAIGASRCGGRQELREREQSQRRRRASRFDGSISISDPRCTIYMLYVGALVHMIPEANLHHLDTRAGVLERRQGIEEVRSAIQRYGCSHPSILTRQHRTFRRWRSTQPHRFRLLGQRTFSGRLGLFRSPRQELNLTRPLRTVPVNTGREMSVRFEWTTVRYPGGRRNKGNEGIIQQ